MMKVCVIGGGQAGFQVCESMVNKGYNYYYDGNSYKVNHFYTTKGATWKGIG